MQMNAASALVFKPEKGDQNIACIIFVMKDMLEFMGIPLFIICATDIPFTKLLQNMVNVEGFHCPTL